MTRLIFACGVAVLVVVACSGSEGGPTGGPVAGAADTHCTLPDGGTQAQPISLASCTPTGGDAGVIDYGETEFNQETANLEPISMDLLFDADGFGEVRIHVSVINGSIFIRTAVPEHVIEYVRAVLEQIKSGHAGGP